ncbi:nitrite reductase [Hathewaya limosa]|uniref:Dissimilatory sulfite reductase (Desulfoviridin) alpha/beta subunit n=1 Tax=Hathewaya limosa TaxID=1536 RepID=A0ABU0JT41_HATLI|nr:nitrite reductase [Hathewaya limosa]MDQ0480224.1 dissimilatory sulfite reductase (desulfoviridin) alpha/beta subunit [Hathewaya limosa]
MELGVIHQKNNKYALRILGKCGVFSAEDFKNLSELASQYGNGKLTATSRGTIEINGISEENISLAYAKSKELGLLPYGTGKIVRAVVACKGSECTKGFFDVHKVACNIENEFLGIPVPKKFKIGVFGCPNSLGKAQSQDVGILPCFSQKGKFTIYIGGMMGKSPSLGFKLNHAISEENLIPAIKIILDFYCNNGNTGERFGATLKRLSPTLEENINNAIASLK